MVKQIKKKKQLTKAMPKKNTVQAKANDIMTNIIRMTVEELEMNIPIMKKSGKKIKY